MAEEDSLIVDETNGEGLVLKHDDDVKLPVKDAEEAVLGIFMQDDECAAWIAQSGLRQDHFLKRGNRLLFPIILNVRQRMGTCNVDFIIDECEKKKLQNDQSLLNFIGGPSRLMEILNTPIAIDIRTTEGYVKIVFDQWKMSKVKEITRQITGLSSYEEGKIVDKIASLQSILSETTISKNGLVGIDQLMPEAYLRYMDRLENPEKYEPIRTGFTYIDKYRAISKGKTAIVAARTNVGKSVIVCNMINKMINDNRHILLFTPEMDKGEYVDRMICSDCKIDIDNWKEANDQIDKSDIDKVIARQQWIAENNPNGLFIEDRGSQTVKYILNTLRKHMLSYPVDVVVLDYIQKLRFYTDNIRREIDDALDMLSSFAKDNDIAMIIVSQLRRADAKSGPLPDPRLNDLKESGNLENYADSVILLHRTGIVATNEYGWYQIAKNRTGPVTDGVVELKFEKQYLLYTEIDPYPEKDTDGFKSSIKVDEMDDIEREAKKLAEQVDNGEK